MYYANNYRLLYMHMLECWFYEMLYKLMKKINCTIKQLLHEMTSSLGIYLHNYTCVLCFFVPNPKIHLYQLPL